MNSKTTRIWTTLRYLVLGPMIAFGLLSIIATGGGGGGDAEGCFLFFLGPDCGPPPPPPEPSPPPPLPTVAFQAATSATADEAAGNHAINVVLSSSTPTEIFVVVTDALSGTATSGTDYTAGARGFTFPHGAIQETFILTVLADTLVEGNETVDLQLGNVTGAVLGVQTTHEVTITDDDLIDLIDLSLAKTVSNPTPPVGNAVVFTLTLRNAARMADASGVVVTDALPVGYRYVSDDGGAATAVAGNTVTWTVGSLVQGTSTSLDITATVMPGGAPYVNDAEVTAANETDLDSTPGDATGDDFAMVGTTPTGVRAYVSSQFDEALSVIDTATNTVVDTITLPLGTLGNFSPHGVAVHPHGTRVYVVSASSPGSIVSVIDTATNRVTKNIGVGANALTVAVLPDGTKAYVTNKHNNTLAVINTATNTVTSTIAVGDNPFSVAVHPAGTAVYTANEGSTVCSPGCVSFPASVSVIDPATDTVVNTIPVPRSTTGIAVHPDGSKVYASRNSSPGEVAVIDTATNTVTTTITVGNGTRSLAVHPDGSKVYTTNGDDGTVSVIDTTTNTVIATVTVTAAVSTNDPVGVAVHPDGNTVYVTNGDDDTVTVIDTATNTEVATIPVGDGPWSVGQFIWRP